METRELIEKSFTEMKAIYEADFESFYPTFNSRGIDERNLTHKFLAAINRVCKSTSLPTWQEIPFIKPSAKRKMDRLDGAAFNVSDKALILIEAKRLRTGQYRGKSMTDSSLQKIWNDSERLGDKERLNYLIDNGDMFKPNRLPEKIYRVMIADTWLDEKNGKPYLIEAFDKWRTGSAFPPEWNSLGHLFLTQDVQTMPTYKLMIAMAPVLNVNGMG